MEPVQKLNGIPMAEAGAVAPKATAPAGQQVEKPGSAIQRWSASRKRDVVLRMLRGESLDALSRELGVELYRLEKWRDKALTGLETSLREREGDPVQAELDGAMQRIGELTMENELLRRRCNENRPLGSRRSKR
jgi:hypothetical protein